jgi:tellurite resistance-related uncharacterized protein
MRSRTGSPSSIAGTRSTSAISRPGHAPYKRTASFRSESIPAGLRGRHSTKPGVWAIIHVASGELEYFDLGEPSESRRVLAAGEQVFVPPEREHRVAAADEVEFYVEFWRAGPSPAP